ncbi:MAG: APC family permease [Acidimicrobiales bacterium]
MTAAGKSSSDGTVLASPREDVPQGLRQNILSLRQGVVISLATSAPGQSTAVALASMTAVAAYASTPALLLSLIPVMAIAICYQRLNKWEQNCGGPLVWVGHAIGPYLGFLVGWAMLVGFVLGAVSALVPLGPAMLSLAGVNASAAAANVISVSVFGAVLTGLAAIGVRATARYQIISAVVEYTILLGFSALSFWVVFVGHRRGAASPTLDWLKPSGVGGHGSLSGAMLIAIFIYTGWDAPLYLNQESQQRRINPGRAVIIGVTILGPLYAWLFLSLQGAVPQRELQAHASNVLPYIATALAGSTWGKAMVFALILSIMGTLQATLVATSRVAYAMGNEQLLPRPFARIHPRFRTPAFSTVLCGVIAVMVADLCFMSLSMSSAIATIVSASGLAFAFFYICTALATIVRSRGILTRSVTDAVLGGVVPLIGAGVLSWIFYASIPQLTPPGRWSLLVIAVIGCALMFVSAKFVRASYFVRKPKVAR